MMGTKQKLLRSMSWSLLDKLINQVGFMFVSLYIARIIGPASYGMIGLLTIFVTLSECILSGFSQALVQKSYEVTEDDCSTAFYINLIWACLFYIILYCSAPYIAQFYKLPELTFVARVLFLVVFVNSLMVVFRAKLIINLDFKGQAFAATFASILSAILAIYLVNSGYGYWAIVAIILSKQIIILIFLFFYTKWYPSWRFSKRSFISLFQFGSYLMFAGIIATIMNNLSIMLIGRFFNVTQVGYFAQANNMSSQLSELIGSTLQGVTYPLMASVKKERERLIFIYKKLISLASFISFPLLVGLAAIADEVILLLLGKEWQSVAPLLTALCLSMVATPISGVNMNILKAIGRSDLFLKIDLIKIPMILIAIIGSIPFGINVLAYTMIFTSIIAFFINTYYPNKLFDFGAVKQLKVVKNYIIGALIMFLVLKLIAISINYLILLILFKVLIGAIVYMLFLWVVKDKLFIECLSEVSRLAKKMMNK
ncbi:lipopolysaccharide biosynthesis protein [Wohlfahrtiimonas populi]|uniref:lipopolysaccharide biosynthesis protein n=1 Tax=Wohlfahrtiimonas populi TaxID=1940240 RepID=UPI00098D292F